jgi:hypothetical protein
MAKLFSEKSMVIVKKYGRLFLRNTTLFLTLTPAFSKKQLCVVLYRVN